MRISPSSAGFIILLGALSALPPLGIDMNLPSMPAMTTDLHQPVARAGMTLSVFLLGFALSPLLLAPLSDYWGRRPILLAGLSLFAVAGLLCAIAPTLAWVLIGRLFQGMGAGVGAAMPLAIIRDSFAGSVARGRISYVSTVLNFAPLVAPSLGALVLPVVGWRGIFVVLGTGGLVLLALIGLGLDESLVQKRRETAHPRRLPGAYTQILSHRRIMGFSLVNALCFASLFGFVSASPLVVMGQFGLSPSRFGLVFGCAACGLIAGSLINASLARRQIRHDRVLLAALCGNAAVTLAMFLLALAHQDRLALLLPLLVGSQFCYGIASPNAVHEALQPMAERAGIVSGVLRCLQMLAGSAAAALVAWAIGRGLVADLAMTGMMAASTGTALVILALTNRAGTPLRP